MNTRFAISHKSDMGRVLNYERKNSRSSTIKQNNSDESKVALETPTEEENEENKRQKTETPTKQRQKQKQKQIRKPTVTEMTSEKEKTALLTKQHSKTSQLTRQQTTTSVHIEMTQLTTEDEKPQVKKPANSGLLRKKSKKQKEGTFEDRIGSDMTKLTGTLFGIAKSMAQDEADHGSGEPSALKKLLVQFDKEGGIGKYEIEQFLNELGSCPPEEKIDEMIARFDGDDNGILVLNEFLAFLLYELQINDTEEEIIDAFKTFDKDGNGFINAQEIRRVMTNLGDKLTDDEVDIMIRKSDLDGDGQVNYEEFTKIIMAKMRAFEDQQNSQKSALME